MLTNKDIIDSLIKVGYNIDEISTWTKINVDSLNKVLKDEEVDINEQSLNQFFRMNMAEVDIDNFKNEDYRKFYFIMTPNGFKKVNDYKDEGKQHCFKISFDSFETIVTNKVLFQYSEDVWTTSDKIKVGDKVKVYDEELEVKSVEEVNDIDCCSIVVEDDQYYLDGLVTK